MIFSMIDQREDDAAAEWNLLKVGGFVYLQPSEDGRPQVVCANSIAFHRNGCTWASVIIRPSVMFQFVPRSLQLDGVGSLFCTFRTQ